MDRYVRSLGRRSRLYLALAEAGLLILLAGSVLFYVS